VVLNDPKDVYRILTRAINWASPEFPKYRLKQGHCAAYSAPPEAECNTNGEIDKKHFPGITRKTNHRHHLRKLFPDAAISPSLTKETGERDSLHSWIYLFTWHNQNASCKNLMIFHPKSRKITKEADHLMPNRSSGCTVRGLAYADPVQRTLVWKYAKALIVRLRCYLAFSSQRRPANN
jgi:hypothetical protein